jgi:hypothetical protein
MWETIAGFIGSTLLSTTAVGGGAMLALVGFITRTLVMQIMPARWRGSIVFVLAVGLLWHLFVWPLATEYWLERASMEPRQYDKDGPCTDARSEDVLDGCAEARRKLLRTPFEIAYQTVVNRLREQFAGLLGFWFVVGALAAAAALLIYQYVAAQAIPRRNRAEGIISRQLGSYDSLLQRTKLTDD